MRAAATIPAYRRPRWIVAAVTLLVCAFVGLSFASLIPLGPWYDEWYTIGHIRDDGFRFVRNRLLGWSPRPLSELFVFAYARAIVYWDRPLVTPALAFAWTFLGAAVLLPPLLSRRGLVASAVLGCLLLLGHQIEEVFYWPIAAFAYLPTLAAAVLILVLDWAGVSQKPAGRVATICALLVAVTASEVGAIFACLYSVLAAGVLVATRDRGAVWFALPFVASLGVFYLITHGRVQYLGEVFGDANIAHHPWAAIKAALRTFTWQLVQTDPTKASIKNLTIALVTKLLFAAGIYLAVPLGPADRTIRQQLQRAALAGALLGSAFLTLASAYGQFGMDCCQRHGTMRQCFVLVAIGTVATMLAAWRRPSRGGMVGAVLLLGAVLVPAGFATRSVASDYRRWHQFADVRTAIWRSGQEPTASLVIPQTEPGKIVGGPLLKPGTYGAAAPDAQDTAKWMMSFFHKSQGVVEAPTASR